MTKIALPASLAAATQEAEALELRITRTRAALEAAQERAERARVETIQAEAERDRLAAERDMALAAQAMGEQPEVDPAALEKQMAAAGKRLAAERTERDAAEGALRGLQARLTRELAERKDVLARLSDGQRDARVALEQACDAAFGRLADLIVREIGPLALAEAAVNGSHVRHQVERLVLDTRRDQPIRHMVVQQAIRTSTPPADFQWADTVARRLARAVEHEAA